MSEHATVKNITLERRDNAVIVRPQAKIMDDDALKALIRLLDEAAGANSGIALVILDLSGITILPSLALGLLVQMSKNCKAREQKLKLARLQPQIRKVFAVTRLDRVFPIADTIESALE